MVCEMDEKGWKLSNQRRGYTDLEKDTIQNTTSQRRPAATYLHRGQDGAPHREPPPPSSPPHLPAPPGLHIRHSYRNTDKSSPFSQHNSPPQPPPPPPGRIPHTSQCALPQIRARPRHAPHSGLRHACGDVSQSTANERKRINPLISAFL